MIAVERFLLDIELAQLQRDSREHGSGPKQVRVGRGGRLPDLDEQEARLGAEKANDRTARNPKKSVRVRPRK